MLFYFDGAPNLACAKCWHCFNFPTTLHQCIFSGRSFLPNYVICVMQGGVIIACVKSGLIRALSHRGKMNPDPMSLVSTSWSNSQVIRIHLIAVSESDFLDRFSSHHFWQYIPDYHSRQSSHHSPGRHQGKYPEISANMFSAFKGNIRILCLHFGQ